MKQLARPLDQGKDTYMQSNGKKRSPPLGGSLFLMVLFFAFSALAEIPMDGFSPTTSLPTDNPYRPILVNISIDRINMPHLNLSKADIIYEGIVWGPGYTRLTAVYNDHHPDEVGYTRGTRVFEMSLRQAWDCPLVHWGGQGVGNPGTSVADFMVDHDVPYGFSISGIKPNGFRSSHVDPKLFKRVADANAYGNLVHLKKIMEEAWPNATDGTPYMPRLPGLSFSNAHTQGKETANIISVQYRADEYNDYNPIYVYDEATQRYMRWFSRGKHMDDGSKEQIAVSNVIVQTIPLTFVEGDMMRPRMAETGSGPIDAYIGGTRIQGTWRRETVNDPYSYLDQDGYTLTLHPGKTFIQIIPETIRLREEKLQDGTFAYVVKL